MASNSGHGMERGRGEATQRVVNSRVIIRAIEISTGLCQAILTGRSNVRRLMAKFILKQLNV